MSVCYVLKGYPRLSETFISQEILALERTGLDLRLISLRHPTESMTHPIHSCIRASVTYLPEYLYQDPARVVRAWHKARSLPGYRIARRKWLTDLLRDPSANRVRRFGQALVLAAELPSDVQHLHAHFLHTPASVTRYASHMVDIPWSCSAHAKDIWTTPKWEIRTKLKECNWVVTCTIANLSYLRSLSPDPDRITLSYHGLDFDRFPPPAECRSAQRGADPSAPVIMLSVGRAVEKKGYECLLDTLAGLPQDLAWRLVHIGGGPLMDKLKAQATALGIEDRISWQGTAAHDQVLTAYRSADLFVLPCRIAKDGDRDGLPNVLLEAQSQKLPCVSTRISGIPELIEDEVTGLLVEQQDIDGLRRALYRLMSDPELRVRLGNAGYQRVRKKFSLPSEIRKLARKFDLAKVTPLRLTAG
ncbi:MAG: glycosyltransferase [Gammaproteobacteria bacterium]|nr:glycosyltransferase [Gammaproteobacteria bacterium]